VKLATPKKPKIIQKIEVVKREEKVKEKENENY
jgi:hypothetical protein